MLTVVALNLVVILLIVILAAARGNDKNEGKFYAWFAFCVCFGLSLIGWILYVAAHFIAKFW